jgi:nitroreductase
MTVTEAIRNRRSIRKYRLGAEVTQEQSDSLLTAAMMAPSAGHTRPWEFVVIRDRKTLDAIPAIQPFTTMLKTASLAIVVCALPQVQTGHLKGFFPQDCGAASENILLQALDLGLGACWCGFYPNEDRVVLLAGLLGSVLSPGAIPINVIALGVPDESPEARGKYEAARVKYL